MITIIKEKGAFGSRAEAGIRFTTGLLKRKGMTDTLQTVCEIFVGGVLWAKEVVVKNVQDRDDRAMAMIHAFRRAAKQRRFKKPFLRAVNRAVHEQYKGCGHSAYEWATPIQNQKWLQESCTFTIRESGILGLPRASGDEKPRVREVKGHWTDEASSLADKFWKDILERKENLDLGRSMHESFLKGFMGGALAGGKSLEETVRDFIHGDQRNEASLREDVEETIKFLKAVR